MIWGIHLSEKIGQERLIEAVVRAFHTSPARVAWCSFEDYFMGSWQADDVCLAYCYRSGEFPFDLNITIMHEPTADQPQTELALSILLARDLDCEILCGATPEVAGSWVDSPIAHTLVTPDGKAMLVITADEFDDGGITVWRPGDAYYPPGGKTEWPPPEWEQSNQHGDDRG